MPEKTTKSSLILLLAIPGCCSVCACCLGSQPVAMRTHALPSASSVAELDQQFGGLTSRLPLIPSTYLVVVGRAGARAGLGSVDRRRPCSRGTCPRIRIKACSTQAFAAARRHLGEVLSAFEFFDAGALQEALDHVPGVQHPTPEGPVGAQPHIGLQGEGTSVSLGA